MIETNATYKIITPISEGGVEELKRIEECGRLCYKSQPKDDSFDSTKRFVDGVIRRGHLSVIEHSTLSVIFTVDRCVSHELVRHRLASFSQESTRYCNYTNDRFGGEIKILTPDLSMANNPEGAKAYLNVALGFAETAYIRLVNDFGVPVDIARRVLPQCLATDIAVTANYREWLHIFELRTKANCDPMIRKVLSDLLAELKTLIPIIFDRVEAQT